MNKLIVYMKSGVNIAAIAQVDYDVFTGKLIPYDSIVYSDGKYRWTSELIYYVEKYGLLPQEDFIKHALSEGRVKITVEDLFGKLD